MYLISHKNQGIAKTDEETILYWLIMGRTQNSVHQSIAKHKYANSIALLEHMQWCNFASFSHS